MIRDQVMAVLKKGVRSVTIRSSTALRTFATSHSLVCQASGYYTYYSPGKYEAAEKMSLRALDGREKALGMENPDPLSSFSSLASMLQKQGKYKAVEELTRRALDGREKVLEEEHPLTLRCVHFLAQFLHQWMQYKNAITLYDRPCAGFQKVLSFNHPDTLACFKQ